MAEAAAVVAGTSGWDNPDITLLEQFKKPTSLQEYLREEKDRA